MVTANLVHSNFNKFLSDCRNVSIFSGVANCKEMKDLNQIVGIFLHFNSCPIISFKGENDRIKVSVQHYTN